MKAGRAWRGSGGFLAVLHAQQRLAESVTQEHEVMRQANLAFRRVSSHSATAVISPDHCLPAPHALQRSTCCNAH